MSRKRGDGATSLHTAARAPREARVPLWLGREVLTAVEHEPAHPRLCNNLLEFFASCVHLGGGAASLRNIAGSTEQLYLVDP